MTQLFADRAWLPTGWARDVRFEIDADGWLTGVQPDAAPDGAPRLDGPVIPGIPNLHSHAFQRAMAGLAEHGSGEDSFWTWRELMYRFVGQIAPEQVEAIAAQLYVEMLKAGYTAVGEFHYLHHDTDGRPYRDLPEMAWRVLSAARHTGIGMTLLPVLYGYGGFGAQPPGEGQRRFLNEPERLLRLVDRVRGQVADDPQIRVGLAPHSLRAVIPDTLAAAVEGLREMEPTAPVHIHAAEQTREVEDCLAWSNLRPVEWLLERSGELDRRWCLIHCTHVTEREVRALARSGAVAGLCPVTEANLGDGVFPAEAYLDAGGSFGVGSDSHISVSPIEELRLLEYGQRLTRQRRNVLSDPQLDGSTGATLLDRALAGGAQALARPIGRLAPGCRADLLVLDDTAPPLAGLPADRLPDAFVFAGNRNPVRDVFVGGRQVVEAGHHAHEDAILAGYRRALGALLDDA
jgi:formimidoylglutamate deiminase